MRHNGERRHPCPHVAIDSDCRGTGKRTLLHHIGLGHQGRREKLYGIDDSRIPVVCINAPPEPGTPADWSAALAAFLGWDLYRPDTQQRPVQRMKDFTGPAVHVMRHSRTEVCLVDGIDRLRPEDLQPTFDFFDYLADELELTVFWSGIGSSDILREARAARFPRLRRPTEATAQIRPRSVPTLWVNRLPPRCKEHPDEWVSTVATLDGRLSLRHHRPGSLLDYEGHLPDHRRAHGTSHPSGRHGRPACHPRPHGSHHPRRPVRRCPLPRPAHSRRERHDAVTGPRPLILAKSPASPPPVVAATRRLRLADARTHDAAPPARRVTKPEERGFTRLIRSSQRE
ncbi:ATP-binding protein [Streptomyces griseorubiginosus]|uniref:ATP-binding protein n=1 Tax=Streptomyces griseorubiginosus TaxID=67304 RepID=UPI0013C4A302|nr:ATP-binding protein [Streptomyces griseorubiginosus]